MKYLKSISMLLLLLPIEAMAQFAWYGANGKAQVVTGLGNGTHTEGIWFSFTDNVDGGESTVVFLDSRGETPTDEDVKTYGGIKGMITLCYGGCSYTLGGIGFPIVGENNEEGDATKWGGISVGYKSDKNISVQLGLSNSKEAQIGYENPEYIIPATNTEAFVRIPWSDFKQPAWATHQTMSGPDAASQLVSLKFAMNGIEGTYNFVITKIGSYDMPETPESPSGCTSPAVAIDNNDDWYTISGVQLRNQPTERGVYIHRGQKIVIK